jgi:hypothetical protein
MDEKNNNILKEILKNMIPNPEVKAEGIVRDAQGNIKKEEIVVSQNN